MITCLVIAVLTIPGLIYFAGGKLPRHLPDLLIALGVCALVAVGAIAINAIPVAHIALLWVFTTAIIGTFCYLLDRAGVTLTRRLILAVGCCLSLSPVIFFEFWQNGLWLYRSVGTLDYASALVFGLQFGIVVAFFKGLAGQEQKSSQWPKFLGAVMFCIGSVAFALGLELQMDETSTIALTNSLLSIGFGSLTAIVVERIVRARNSFEGAGRGAIAGTIVALSACPYLEPVPAAILGLLAGGIAEASCSRANRVARTAAPFWAGASVGLLGLGVFATTTGFVYSGSLLQLSSQLVAVVTVAVWSTVVGLGLRWLATFDSRLKTR